MYGRNKNLIQGLLALTVFVAGCTDNRPKTVKQGPNLSTLPVTSSSIVFVSDRQFNGAATVVQQMQIKGASLYMTGRPFGFTRWEVSPNPESPSKTFAIADNIPAYTAATTNQGAWIPDYYARGALEIFGSIAYMSGNVGLSMANITNSFPAEMGRKQGAVNGNTVQADDAYAYEAMVQNPNRSVYYGFRKQDYVYTVDSSTVALALIRREAYGAAGQAVCCVTGATVFNNRIYVSFGDRMVMFDMANDGRLIPAGSYTELHAANVVSTPKYLYVQHEPIANPAGGNFSTRPRGIYVFDAAGNAVDRIDTGVNLLRMAVSWNDGHVYANVDNQAVRIYRIQWNATAAQ